MEKRRLKKQFIDLLDSVVSIYREILKPEKVLHIKASEFNIFIDYQTDSILSLDNINKLNTLYEKLIDPNILFNLVVGDFPFWLQWAKIVNKNTKLKFLEDEFILQASKRLWQEWIGIYMVRSSFFLQSNKILIDTLNQEWIYINGVFNLPKDSLAPFTSLQPILIIISRKENKSLYISELSYDSNIESIVWNYYDSNSNDLANGIFIERDSFMTFDRYKAHEKIRKLSTIYSEFSKYRLWDIANITILKDHSILDDKEESIFFPSIWNSQVLSWYEELKLTQKNYFQIEVKTNVFKAEYLAYFFRSELGWLIRSSLISSSTIPHVNKSDLLDIELPLPDISTQEKIIKAYKKLDSLKQGIIEVENELSINPITSWILEEMKNIEESIGKMKNRDFITSLILRWESKVLEFKKCLWSIKEQNSNGYNLTKAILKTICAFLNTDWGILLIWVTDDGNIFWIENDISCKYKSKDDYLKNFRNLVIHWIWLDYADYLDYDIETVNWKNILIINCKMSDSPVYFEDKFYIRTNPSTNELTPKELVNYVSSHFKKN